MKKILKLSVLIVALMSSCAVYESCSPESGHESGQEAYRKKNILKIGVMSFDIQSAAFYRDDRSEGWNFVFATEPIQLGKALGKPPLKHALCLDIPFCDMGKQFNYLASVPDGVDWHFTFESCYDGELSGFYSQSDIKDGNMRADFRDGTLELEFYAATYDGNFVRCSYSGKPVESDEYIWDFRKTRTNTRLIGGRRFVDLGDGRIWAAWNIGASSEYDYGDLFENSGKGLLDNGGKGPLEIGGKDLFDNRGKDLLENREKDLLENSGKDLLENREKGLLEIGEKDLFDNSGKDLLEDGGKDLFEIGGKGPLEDGGKGLLENGGKDLLVYSGKDLLVYREKENSGEDLAEKLWGDGWHVPSQEEWTGMVSSCRWSWAESGSVSGLLGTSIYTGESLFLPAAGFADPQGRPAYRDIFGNYWSSSPYSNDEYVCVWFNEDSSVPQFSDSDRMDKLSVRPVMSRPPKARSH